MRKEINPFIYIYYIKSYVFSSLMTSIFLEFYFVRSIFQLIFHLFILESLKKNIFYM